MYLFMVRLKSYIYTFMQALMFKRCNGLRLNGLTHINSPRVHITVTACNGVIMSNLRIIAPETSPNTDGINIASSTNVNIRDSIIGTGNYSLTTVDTNP